MNFAMTWFVIGAVIGCFIGFVGLLRKGPGYANYPIQGFIFSAVLGAIVVGIPLWILSRIFCRLCGKSDCADSSAAFGAVDSSMTHISGHHRSQMLLLPEAVDDYVGADNPVRFSSFAPRLGNQACEAEATAAAIPTVAVMNSRRCIISSFEVRTYSTTTPGTAQDCQLYGPNQEPKARSDYALAQLLRFTLAAARLAFIAAGACHREWPCFHRFAIQEPVKLNLPQLQITA